MTAIIYWSGTGNTEAMANAINTGLQDKGEETIILPVDKADEAMIDQYEKIVFGCPSMGAEVLEESEFEPFFAGIESKLNGKKVALFGSYGWGDGEWMRDWSGRTKDAGALLYGEGLIQQEAPDEEACKEYGRAFAAF